METQKQKARRIILMLLVAAGTIVFGFVVFQAGYDTLHEWRAIGAALAACGVLWVLSGPAMLVGGSWVLASLARRPTPLWLAGTASVVAGGVLVAGVLARVIPCSGPS
jgi:hypothetical protein